MHVIDGYGRRHHGSQGAEAYRRQEIQELKHPLRAASQDSVVIDADRICDCLEGVRVGVLWCGDADQPPSACIIDSA